MALRVTLRMLKRIGACYDEREAFARVFPQGVQLTRETLRQASDAGLNVAWFANNLKKAWPKSPRVVAAHQLSWASERALDEVHIACIELLRAKGFSEAANCLASMEAVGPNGVTQRAFADWLSRALRVSW